MICVWLIWNDLGVIAFVGSILGCIWSVGLRDKFSTEETASAYSVFNEGGKGIAGGLTGEQLDRQLRGGFSKGVSETNGAVARAALVETDDAPSTSILSKDEKLRRRRDAAAAAEKRFRLQER